eukprot:1139972-Amphidinium_carterae.1
MFCNKSAYRVVNVLFWFPVKCLRLGFDAMLTYEAHENVNRESEPKQTLGVSELLWKHVTFVASKHAVALATTVSRRVKDSWHGQRTSALLGSLWCCRNKARRQVTAVADTEVRTRDTPHKPRVVHTLIFLSERLPPVRHVQTSQEPNTTLSYLLKYE